MIKQFLLPVISGLLSLHLSAQTDLHGNFSNDKKTGSVSSQKVAGFSHNNPVIIKVLQSPTSTVGDIAFDGSGLWVGGYGDMVLYKVSTVNGAVLKTIPTNIARPYGLEFVNGFLYVADTDNHLIQKVDTANGNVISSFLTPGKYLNSYPTGLAWDGQYFWNNDPNSTNWNLNDSTFQISLPGQTVQSHHGFGEYITGLTWDGHYLWSSDNKRVELYKIDVATFTVVDTINAPGGLFPNGLAFDGQYLWVSNNDSDLIYQILGSSVTSLAEEPGELDFGFSIYPNPTANEMILQIGPKKLGSAYAITDQLGREFLKGKLEKEQTTIDLENFVPGVYYCRVGERKKPLKIIKQ